MKIVSKALALLTKPVTWFKNLRKRMKLLVLAVLAFLFIGIIASVLFGPKTTDEDLQDTSSVVELKSPREIATTLDPLPLVGNVRSATEATILTEASGRVTRVYRSLGDYVSAGSVIAEIENSSEYAAVLQAEANLARVEDSSEDEQLSSAITGLQTAKESSLATILSAYATVQDAIRQKADATFSNPTTASAEYEISTSDSALENQIESRRVSMQRILSRQQATGAILTTESNLDVELKTALDELKEVRTYLDLVVESLNKAIPNNDFSTSDISSFSTSVSTGRTAVTTSISSIAASIENLAAKRAAKEIAENSLENSTTGVKRQDVLQAEASLAAARAAFEKKVIRAPFSGTVNALNIELGQFVSAFEPAATIANNGILEIRAYITERDKEYVFPGLSVSSLDGIKGTITEVAPALDPITKRIEVRIALSDTGSITNGQSIRLLVERTKENVEVVTPIVPLTAITFKGNDPFVFTVDQENTLVAVPVTLGVILGDRIEIEGIDVDTQVVVDARGFLEGEVVTTN
ncbi:MAG: efflux RND transporter periplasmic adaptor subunit [Patescibacteria group bacterium UBA2103]